MRLTRLGQHFSYEHDGKTIVGARGLLVVGPAAWPTVERWGIDTMLLLGTYACTFAWWTGRKGQRARAIRVLLSPEQFERIYPESRRIELVKQYGERRARGRIYCPHPANEPHELDGCVAAGLRESPHGVLDSVTACGQIYDALGGWKEGGMLELEVA